MERADFSVKGLSVKIRQGCSVNIFWSAEIMYHLEQAKLRMMMLEQGEKAHYAL